MEHGRDEEAEEVLGDIILAGGDILSYLNDNDGLEEQGEEAGCGDRRVEEERHDYDGSGDQCWCKKEPVVTAPVTEQSPAR